MSLLSRHDNITPFTSRQYHSLIGHLFSLGVPACNSPLDVSASDDSRCVLGTTTWFSWSVTGKLLLQNANGWSESPPFIPVACY